MNIDSKRHEWIRVEDGIQKWHSQKPTYIEANYENIIELYENGMINEHVEGWNAISKMIMESMSVLERNTYQNINIHREQEKKSGQNQGEDSQCLVNDILLCLANNNYVWKRLTIHDRDFFSSCNCSTNCQSPWILREN